ncbi:MAG: hypothetical protein LBT21_00735 [Oscillospiraceae bacterium]|jgi:REP element-mobilizing transposase RayT|nr:hypothetical protein [Oscillospiraceae bacterium]
MSESHNRRSIRLKGFDYSQDGLYCITICTFDWQETLGQSLDGQMHISPFGTCVLQAWSSIPLHFPRVRLREFVLMPNHLHGIIELGSAYDVGARHDVPLPASSESFGQSTPGTIPTIVRLFKSGVTKAVNETRNTPGERFWQRNYHEHIIRDKQDYMYIAEKIRTNPQTWEEDQFFAP